MWLGINSLATLLLRCRHFLHFFGFPARIELMASPGTLCAAADFPVPPAIKNTKFRLGAFFSWHWSIPFECGDDLA